VALALCWLALGLTVVSLLRNRSASAASAEGEEPAARTRKAPLAALLVTSGVLIWTISLAGLPLVVADCSRPLVPLTPASVHDLCPSDARVYPLQVSVLNLLYDAVSAQPISLAQQGMPGTALLGVLNYFRDFALLVLAVVAAPLALVAVWRRPPERGTAAWLSAWVVLGFVETGFLLGGLSVLLAPHPPPFVRSAFAEGFGPGAVLAPLGMVVMVAGVVVYWLQLQLQPLPPSLFLVQQPKTEVVPKPH
jgi:hypothetical protein